MRSFCSSVSGFFHEYSLRVNFVGGSDIRLALRCGASSTTKWQLVPPKPKEEIPARRTPCFGSQLTALLFGEKGEFSKDDLWIHDESDLFKAQILTRFFDDPKNPMFEMILC